MHDLLETVPEPASTARPRLPKPGLNERGSQVVSASATLRDLALLLRAKTRPSGYSCAGREILRTPFPSCLDFPTAHSGGRRFDRICRTQTRCRDSSSTMSAWATATSP